MRAFLLGAVAAVLVPAACSSNVKNETGASGAQASAGSTGSMSAGSGGAMASGTGAATSSSAQSASASSGSGGGACQPVARDDCASDSDCPGGKCVAVTPGGFKTCQTPPTVQTQCKTPQDQCCAQMPCKQPQQCLLAPVVPYCGGAQMLPHNECAADQCKSDGDCVANQFETQICAGAGVLGRQVAACLTAACHTNADCKAEPCGVCAPVQDACCGAFKGLYCVYPSNGCRTDADCKNKGMAKYCRISQDQSRAQCEPNPPPCPG